MTAPKVVALTPRRDSQPGVRGVAPGQPFGQPVDYPQHPRDRVIRPAPEFLHRQVRASDLALNQIRHTQRTRRQQRGDLIAIALGLNVALWFIIGLVGAAWMGLL